MKELRQPFAPRRRSRPLVLIGASAAAVLAVGIAVGGIGFLVAVRDLLEFYSGPVALIALSLTVMVGLAATDRLVLTIRLRILLQIAHRMITMAGLAFLGVHVILKVAMGKADPVNAVLPFSSGRVAVDLGTLAALGWLAITLTGLVRARFATWGEPWMWRVAHSMAYLCWPIAIVHGLTAGRPAALWVILSYSACLVLVGIGLVIRLLATFRTGRALDGRTGPVPPRRGLGAPPAGTEPIGEPTADGALEAEFWASLRREVRRRGRNEVRR
jgi:hypothetical protein